MSDQVRILKSMETARQRILLVEDDPPLSELLRSFFCERGLDVDSVSDGEGALTKLEQSEYSLVITDIRLPGISGLDLLARIQADWSEIAVIIMTAFGSISSAVEAMKLGAENYISKPFQLDELASVPLVVV